MASYIALSNFNVVALAGYAILSLALDLKVLFFSRTGGGGTVSKPLLFMALGFLMFINLMAMYTIAKPLGNASKLAEEEIAPLFRGVSYSDVSST